MTTAIDQTERAKALLKSAAKAADQLESDVRELVAMRAWGVLGYENFSEMWEKENGYAAPSHVQVLAVMAIREEGMNTTRGPGANNEHTHVDVAKAVGLSVRSHQGRLSKDGKRPVGAFDHAPQVSGIFKQLDHGVPPEHVAKHSGGAKVKANIDRFGSGDVPRKRPQPRRMGKLPDELVSEGFTTTRREADEIAEIARKADTTKAEIYRQAVAEYLMRHRASHGESVAS